MTLDDAKRAAALAALAHVKPGMKLGLGTGSTTRHFVAGLAERCKRENFTVLCVPTSEQTRAQAASLSLPLTTLDEQPLLDITVDGADELDGELNLIKGGGGALVREKIVASSSKLVITIADHSKQVKHLGAFALPIEILPFGVKATVMKIDSCFNHLKLAGPITLRQSGGDIYRTDNGNVIADCNLGVIPDPARLAAHLSGIPGIIDHGLFIGLSKLAYIASADGVIEIRR